MKNKRSILSAILVFVLLISTQLTVFGASLSPSLVSAGYSVSKKTVSGGDTFSLNFTLKNTSSDIDIQNVNIKLSGGEAFAVNNDTDTIYASKIAKNGKSSFSKSFYCNEGVATGVYPISLTASYEYFENGEKVAGSAEINYSVKVTQSGSGQVAPLTPQLIVSDFSYGGESINSSQNFELNFNIKNTSKEIAVKNIIVKLSGGEAFAVGEGTDTIPLDTIKANSSVKISKKFVCAGGVTTGAYPITASVTYEYYENGEKVAGSAELSMSIPVVQPDRVEIGSIDLANANITVNQETDCAFSVINSGKTDVSNATVKLVDSDGKEIAKAYIGNIVAGEQFTSNYTLPVTFTKTGKTDLQLVFDYENDIGEKKSVNQSFTVTVEEKHDPYADFMNNEQVPVNDTPNYESIIILVVVGVALVAAVVVIVIVRKKKKARKGSDEFDEEI